MTEEQAIIRDIWDSDPDVRKWNFKEQPRLRVPVRHLIQSGHWPDHPHDPAPIEAVEFRHEHGRYDRFPADRIVGSYNGVEYVCDMVVSRND